MKPPTMHIADMFEGLEMLGVFIRRKDGSEFISNSNLGPALFYDTRYDRKRARERRGELREHKIHASVRRVIVTIRPKI